MLFNIVLNTQQGMSHSISCWLTFDISKYKKETEKHFYFPIQTLRLIVLPNRLIQVTIVINKLIDVIMLAIKNQSELSTFASHWSVMLQIV